MGELQSDVDVPRAVLLQSLVLPPPKTLGDLEHLFRCVLADEDADLFSIDENHAKVERCIDKKQRCLGCESKASKAAKISNTCKNTYVNRGRAQGGGVKVKS